MYLVDQSYTERSGRLKASWSNKIKGLKQP